MKVRAAVLERMGHDTPYTETMPLKIQEFDLAGPGRGEVLVRIRAAGICHSDLSVVTGDRPRPTPMVLGHEAAGEIVETGSDVDDLQPGDHVVTVFVPSCGHCSPCAEGRPALCEPAAKTNAEGTLLSGGRRLSRNGTDVNHHMGVSAFSEYSVLSRRSVIKVDREVPLEEAALFGCAVLTGMGAAINTGALRAGQTAAVIGLGGVGLASVLGAIAGGAEQVIAVDISDEKLAFARQLGATDTVNARDDNAAEQVRELAQGGVDLALEMAGSVKALELAYRITRRGGTTVTAGLPNPADELTIPAVSLVAEERTLKGSYIGTCVPSRDLPRYLSLYKRGRLPVDRLMTHKLSLDQINEGFERLRTGEAVRQIIVP